MDGQVHLLGAGNGGVVLLFQIAHDPLHTGKRLFVFLAHHLVELHVRFIRGQRGSRNDTLRKKFDVSDHTEVIQRIRVEFQMKIVTDNAADFLHDLGDLHGLIHLHAHACIHEMQSNKGRFILRQIDLEPLVQIFDCILPGPELVRVEHPRFQHLSDSPSTSLWPDPLSCCSWTLNIS